MRSLGGRQALEVAKSWQWTPGNTLARIRRTKLVRGISVRGARAKESVHD